MVFSLVKGQKIDLTKGSPDLNLLHIGLDWHAPSHFDIDVSAFMVGQDQKILREEDFVFYGQPASSNGSVRLEDSISSIEKQHFIIDLQKVPQDIQKIAFTLTIYESELNEYTFEAVSNIQLRMVNSRRQEEIAIFPIDYSFTKESAIVLGELYRYSGEWKFQAVGAGFFGGLADLCQEYGVEVEDQPVQVPQNQVQTNPTVSPNQRFQVVQERENSVAGEAIPAPPPETVQLKRPSFVQFNDDRIETLSQQSDVLINLFNDSEEETFLPTAQAPVKTPSANTILQDVTVEEGNESFIQSLSRDEITFLLFAEGGVIPIDQAKAFLKEKGLMMALFVHTINEKACEYLDDNLLEMQADSIHIFEEFEPLVAKLKEKMSHEH